MARKKQLQPIHPGEILLEEFMKPKGISINRLATRHRGPTGTHQRDSSTASMQSPRMQHSA